MKEYYQLDEKQAEIDTLKHQLTNPNIIQKLGFKIFRTDTKLRDNISRLEATKANAEQRLNEATTQLEHNRDRELSGLKKRQAEELEPITKNLEGWRPRKPSLTQAWERTSRERQRSRGYDEPSFSR